MTKFLSSLVLVLALSVSAQSPGFANPHHSKETKCEKNELIVHSAKNKFGHKALTASITIKASPQLVWEAIRDHREADPDVAFSKVTFLSDTERMLEQKYVSIPILGATTCTLHVDEQEYKRIDYNLMKSDRISEFEGSWILTSHEGEETTLELSNHLKLHLPIPQRLVDAFAAPKLKARLAMVKKLAEAKRQSQIASKD